MTTRPPKRATAARRIKGAELARELGVRPQAIYALIKAGKVQRDADGLIDVAKAKAQIAQRVRAFGKTAAAVGAEAQPATAGLAGPATTTTKDVLSYQRSRAMREEEEAQLVRIKRLKEQRRLIDREATLAAVFTAFRTLRDQMMPVGRRLAGRLATMTDARDIQQAIDDELRLVLRQFAEKTLTTATSRIAGPDSKPADRDWIEETTKEPA
ncbi:MAG: hypothetical protein AB7O64_18600 [Methylibium sp.]